MVVLYAMASLLFDIAQGYEPTPGYAGLSGPLSYSVTTRMMVASRSRVEGQSVTL